MMAICHSRFGPVATVKSLQATEMNIVSKVPVFPAAREVEVVHQMSIVQRASLQEMLACSDGAPSCIHASLEHKAVQCT